MKVLDGRNGHEVPKVIEISSFVIANKWTAEDLDGRHVIYELLLDGAYVPCVSDSNRRYDYILCAAYKTERGFMNWLNRMYPYRSKEN